MPLNNPPMIPGVKVELETRARDAAGGDVSYTGYGFRPMGLIIHASDLCSSIGVSEPGLS
ncbi:unnamed protein product, partial [marine sediment metagenome]